MTTPGTAPLPARLAERYTVGPVLGRGSRSVVYRAHDTLLGRDAALKVFGADHDLRRRPEFRLLASLDHPSLLPVYDVEAVDDRAYVAMALAEGGSLADRLADGARGRLDLPAALRTAAAVAEALHHVHAAGVVHRSVTPANVLYDGDGRALLSDTGVTVAARAPRLTDTGLDVGTAAYLAPEQVRAADGTASATATDAAPPADVYALGLTLLEALTGRRAYPGDPVTAAHARLDHAPTLPPGLPAEVDEVLRALTAEGPERRPDAATAAVALRRALVATEPFPVPARLAPATRTGRGRVVRRGAAGAPASRARSRVTTTRGAAALAGLAASAVLAGTVVVSSTSDVAEVSANGSGTSAALAPGAITPPGLRFSAPDDDVTTTERATPESAPSSTTAPSGDRSGEVVAAESTAPQETAPRETASSAAEPSSTTVSPPAPTTTSRDRDADEDLADAIRDRVRDRLDDERERRDRDDASSGDRDRDTDRESGRDTDRDTDRAVDRDGDGDGDGDGLVDDVLDGDVLERVELDDRS